MGLKSYDNFLRSGNIIEPSYDNFLKQTAIIIRRDPYFNLTSLLLHGDGTNATQNNTFLDSSTNNFTITRNGNPTQGTISPYGDNWSNYFDGTGDWLTTPNVSSFDLSSSSTEFTIEAWVYNTGPGTFRGIVGARQNQVGHGWCMYIHSNNTLYMGSTIVGQSYADRQMNTTTIPSNSWVHVALVKTTSGYTGYVNGVGGTLLSLTGGLDYQSTRPVTVGALASEGELPFLGYISGLRIVKGTALYTSNFTPPTSPLTAITNTSLLTCQSNRFRDNSSNNFTITRNGDVSVQKFSPFPPTAAYSSGSFGGSGYFDGSGDYLTAPSNNAFAVGTGDFTFETWIYPRYSFGGSTYQTIAGNRSGAINSTTEWTLGVTNAGSVYVYTNTFNIQTSNGVFTNDQWYHVALVRSSGTATLYINGSSAGTANMSGYNFTDTTFAIGANDDGSETLSAILSNCRLLKGTALYTSNFTPPTAPLTAVTNTSLLLNFTNAAIRDNTSFNNLETVGNVQISTAQSKFGGSSLYFDGTGDYLTSISQTNAFGSENFTIESWCYFIDGTANALRMIWVNYNTWTSQSIYFGKHTAYSGNVTVWVNNYSGSVPLLTDPNLPPANSWVHYAVVRNGSSWTLYRNGTSVSTGTFSGVATTNTLSQVGGNSEAGGAYSMYGYLDDFRITKGLARYTTNFTLPTEAFPDL